MSVVTDTTNHENEVGGGVLAWQMAGAWIPAYAGMTVGVALVVRAGFKPAPTSAGLPGAIFRGIAHVGCHRHNET